MITIPCILCLVYWCLTTSLWIYLQRPQKTQQKHIRSIFFQNPGWYNSLVQRIYAGFYTEKKNTDTKRAVRSHHYIEIEKLRKYLSGILSIENYEADIGERTNQFINDKSNYNKKHIIKWNIQTTFNIPEEPRFISSMTPVGSRNG